jgi:DNA-binding IclR family transcriptional regulator
MAAAKPKRAAGGVNSLEIGLALARVMAAHGQPQALKDLAVRAGMTPAKAHRYLVSLVRAGLAEQDREGGRYRLGPLALDLGMAALNGIDVVKFGSEAILALREAIDETVLLVVWGSKGPVVVRWEETSRPIATNVRAGWVMPLFNSATGRLFAALLPEAMTHDLLQAELAQHPGQRAAYRKRLADIRATGLSRVEGDLGPGVAAVAAPAFGPDGLMVAAIAAVGAQGAIDISLQGPVVAAVQAEARKLSARMGFAAAPGAPAEKKASAGRTPSTTRRPA